MVEVRFVNEVIRVCEVFHNGDLTEIEEDSKDIIFQPILCAFRSDYYCSGTGPANQ